MNLSELANRFKSCIYFDAEFYRQLLPVESPQRVHNEVFRIAEQPGSEE
jgi:hypothetical protein